MRASAFFVVFGAIVLGASAGCGSAVVTDATSSAGGGGSGGGGGGQGGGGGGSCGDDAPSCAPSCSADVLVPPECSASGWVCPEGSVDIGDCPVGTCLGKPPPCSECQMGSWTCSPGQCVEACPAIMCDSCPPNSEPIKTPTCFCSCNEAGQFVCKKTPDPLCCQVDMDCGDFAFVPCVNGVCKQPSANGSCWADTQCPPDSTCVGEFVCPCGSDCDTEDTPGKCVAAP